MTFQKEYRLQNKNQYNKQPCKKDFGNRTKILFVAAVFRDCIMVAQGADLVLFGMQKKCLHFWVDPF